MLAFPAAYQARGARRHTRSHAAAGCMRTHALSLFASRSRTLRRLQEGGWLLGIFFTLLFMLLTVLTSTYLVKVVQHFKQTRLDRSLPQTEVEKASGHDQLHFVEYDTIVRCVCGRLPRGRTAFPDTLR